ncbi:MAG: methyltransferase domain-containing protein [Candidatus Delongbacteria bacterium]|nr:methyltransferase domain-containing protein [Candidatus Delongbacteria bacterium]
MSDIDRIEREKNFHDNRFGGADDERHSARKYYSINKHQEAKFVDVISSLCNNKNLLEYGCGSGEKSLQWQKFGAKVTGIDISPEGIKKAKKIDAKSEYHAEYFVMNAENTEFDDSTFDIVVGKGIIHHLSLEKSYSELSRILKSNGHIVFIEPLGHNPFVNLYRMLTPKMRTKDEHPLKIKDIELLRKYFNNVEADYFSLFTLFAVPFRNLSIFNKICNFLRNIDQLIFKLPFIKRYAWTVITHAYNPRK